MLARYVENWQQWRERIDSKWSGSWIVLFSVEPARDRLCKDDGRLGTLE